MKIAYGLTIFLGSALITIDLAHHLYGWAAAMIVCLIINGIGFMRCE